MRNAYGNRKNTERSGRSGKSDKMESKKMDSKEMTKDEDEWDDDAAPSRRAGRRPSRSRSNTGGNVFDTNQLLAFFDGDGDGQLSLKEIDAASRLLYSLDANEDDRLTGDELAEFAGEGGASQGSSSRSNASSGSSDKNSGSADKNSGSSDRSKGRQGLSLASPGASPGGSSSAAPSRPRGRPQGLSIGGTPTASPGSKAAEAADFDKSDKNGDGVIKRGELSARLRARFSKMDSNGDREVDIDEFEDYMNDPAKNGGVLK